MADTSHDESSHQETLSSECSGLSPTSSVEEDIRWVEIMRIDLDGDEVISFHKGSNIHLRRSDLQRLKDGSYLNDELINVYFKILSEIHPGLFVFNTFFFTMLISDQSQRLRRWTKNVNLFEYNLILIPV